MIQIDEATYFYFFLIFPVMVLLYVCVVYWKKKTQRRFAEPLLLKRLTPSKSSFKGVLKLMFISSGALRIDPWISQSKDRHQIGDC